ncbi:E3 ubiquitin/ISG15 ligase TRIM25-like [Bufo bufo]|uniref:E3 ubiquitin/ISG15 ligase TRIM25-like n=1 Tax=Bufo bufo TaxID=8384 RepID=UPI001ABE059F|nr:E3 ubiquitin/ISG15 ligase TRIM25-like [Bufo bufo]
MMADLREDLECPICLDIFTYPVTLVCGHNFCRKCINQALRRRVLGRYMCPQCRKRFQSRPVLKKNTNLSNIAEHFRCTNQNAVTCTYCDLLIPATKTCLQCETSMCERHLQYHNRSVQHNLMDTIIGLEERKCPIHNKIRSYYCTVDAACICVSCCLSQEYRGLQVEPLNEACEKKKKRLHKVLEAMNVKKKRLKEKRLHLMKTIQKINIQENTPMKTQILLYATDQIQELEEETKELELKKSHIKMLCTQIDPIAVLEAIVIDTDDCTYTERHILYAGVTMEAADKCLPDVTSKAKKWWSTQKPTDLLLNVHTAANDLHVSGNWRAVIYSEIYQAHPKTSDRFKNNQVLSLDKFSSGRHYWDVECSQTGDWMIGVCYPSMVKRGKKSFLGCNTKSWCLRRRGNEFWLQHNNQCLYIPHMTSCNNIRVSLDYNAGQLSFYDLSCPIRHLHTYRIIFIEPVHAAFTLFYGWLQIRNSEDTLPSF